MIENDLCLLDLEVSMGKETLSHRSLSEEIEGEKVNTSETGIETMEVRDV